jgi:WD40 repeat protein
MLNEYPYQLFYSKQSKKLKTILFDLEFAGSVYDNNKQDSFKSILNEAIKLKDIAKDEIYPWESFYREKEYLIVKVDEELWKPHQTVFQLAYEDGDDSPLTKQAEKLLQSEKVEFEWLRLVNRPKNFNRTGLLKVLEGHTDRIRGVEILKDERILSYSDDTTLRLWDKDDNFSKVLEGHTDSIDGVSILEDGKIISYSKDRTLRLWDSQGNFLKELEGHTDRIRGVKILKDERILSYSDDTTLRLWDKDGNFLKLLEGHTKSFEKW